MGRRTELGPTMKFTNREANMALIAQEDTYVEVDGIRRKIVAGSPIPGALAGDAKTETVETRSLAAVVVDEEASLSQAEREKAARKTATRAARSSDG